GQSSGDVGTLHVTGTGVINTAGDINVGNGGIGPLTVDSGGSVTARQVVLGTATTSTGTLNIGSGGAPGTVSATTIITGSSTTSGVVLNHNQSSFTLGAALRGTLTLTQNGPGMTILTDSNQYTGGTV